MNRIRYVFALLGLLFVSACSEAVPTVTDLNPTTPIVQTAPTGQINAGAGTMTSTNFRLKAKIDVIGNEMTGTNFRIITSGDN